MAADITQAVTVTSALAPATWGTMPTVQSADFHLIATTVDLTSFGGSGGGPTRPSSGFLYPRGDQ